MISFQLGTQIVILHVALMIEKTHLDIFSILVHELMGFPKKTYCYFFNYTSRICSSNISNMSSSVDTINNFRFDARSRRRNIFTVTIIQQQKYQKIMVFAKVASTLILDIISSKNLSIMVKYILDFASMKTNMQIFSLGHWHRKVLNIQGKFWASSRSQA